jgi:hypothetical protein
MTKKIEVELPVIPREVAEAIEHYCDVPAGNISIITRVLGGNLGEYERRLTTIPFDDLVTAVYVGYEIEQTPEDKLRAYYENAKQCADIYANGEGFRIEADTIVKTLDLLGIKIGGVNDNADQ